MEQFTAGPNNFHRRIKGGQAVAFGADNYAERVLTSMKSY